MTRPAIAFWREMTIAVTVVLLTVACGTSAQDTNLEFQEDAAKIVGENQAAALVENNKIEETPANNKTSKRNVAKIHDNNNETDDEKKDDDHAALVDNVDNTKKKFAPKFKHPSKLFNMDMKPAGSSIRLKCAADGNPMPNITWFKNNGSIERSYFRPTYGKWWLALDELSRNDNGNYTCLICNELGCISHTVNLLIQERLLAKPVLTKGPSNLTLLVGETAQFHCEFLCDLDYLVYWFFRKYEEYENVTTFNDIDNLVVRTSDDPADKPEMLTISNVTQEDQGWYVCVAMNTLGTATEKGYLTVLDHPVTSNYTDERFDENNTASLSTSGRSVLANEDGTGTMLNRD